MNEPIFIIQLVYLGNIKTIKKFVMIFFVSCAYQVEFR